MKALVIAGGGLWPYRTRCAASKNTVARRLRQFVYSNYLETLGSYVALGATFDGEPKFPHKAVGIFIAPEARIGSGVTIYQQVTIGSNETPGSKGFGSPRIGNDVFIGAGAKIIGNVTVGDGARIGAGAIVVSDVPPGALAVSPKANISLSISRHEGDA